MSKRPRDQASIASLKAILGDIPTATIENLLHRSNNNVEVAVNMYFTEPQQPLSATTQPAAVMKTATSSTIDNSKLRYYIGDLVITGKDTFSI